MKSGAAYAGILLAGAALSGCGSATTPAEPTASLTAVNRLAILQQVVSAALGGVPLPPPAARSDGGPLAGLACEKTCDDATCVVTCPIDESLSCPAGGSATNRGGVEGALDVEETGTASLLARQTYDRCRPHPELSVDGDPETTATGSARFERGRLAEEQTVRVRGAVRYTSGDGSGRCDVDVRVTFTPGLHGAARGTACGNPVDVSF